MSARVRCPHCRRLFSHGVIEGHILAFHQPSLGAVLRQLVTRRFLIYAAVIGVLLLAAFSVIAYSIATIAAQLGVQR
jgi:hypothetical protein